LLTALGGAAAPPPSSVMTAGTWTADNPLSQVHESFDGHS
jgi:hypothetical protein